MPALIDKQLILHAGTHKTGTTAIQDSLERHQAFLAERGYSQATLHRHLRDLHVAFNPKAYGKKPSDIDLHSLRADFRDWAEQQAGTKLILSGEALSHAIWEDWGQDEQVGPFLFEGFASTTILLYIRRQDRFVESAYQELLKHGLAQTFEEYCRAPASDMQRSFDWQEKLARFGSLYPDARLIIRLFDRVRAEGDIFRDFLGAIGVANIPAPVCSEEENPSLDAGRMELLRVCNKHRDLAQRQILLQLFDSGAEMPVFRSPHRRYLDEGERSALLAHYHESNARLFAEHALGDAAALAAWEEISPADRRTEELAAGDEQETLVLIDQLCSRSKGQA